MHGSVILSVKPRSRQQAASNTREITLLIVLFSLLRTYNTPARDGINQAVQTIHYIFRENGELDISNKNSKGLTHTQTQKPD